MVEIRPFIFIFSDTIHVINGFDFIIDGIWQTDESSMSYEMKIFFAKNMVKYLWQKFLNIPYDFEKKKEENNVKIHVISADRFQ